MKTVLLAAVCGALLFAAPASADAAPYLGKYEAHGQAKQSVKRMWLKIDDAIDFEVDAPSYCVRIGRGAVECDYVMYYDSGVECYDTIRVVETTYSYRFRFPYEPECY